MKAYKQLTNILNKFSEDKTELTKAELSIVSDLQKLKSGMDKNFTEANKLSTKVKSFNKEGAKIVQAVKSHKKMIRKLISETNSNEKKGLQLRNQSDGILTKADKSAKELGVKPNEIKGYNEIDKLYDQLYKVNNYNEIDQFGGIFE